MVPAALFPALALIAGAAGGIEFDTQWRVLLWLLPLMTAVAVAGWCLRQPRATLLLTVAAFGCCGFILGSHARERAIDTPLRALVDEDAREPARVRLLLLEDAVSNADLTTLRAQVVSIRARDLWTPTEGSVVLSVGGAAAGPRAAEWRRGRLLEAPVTFRRPARYLDEGVPDFERDAALDGISLLGSIKSALLVSVIERGNVLSELAADVRAYVRRVVGRRVGAHRDLSAAIVSAVLIGDRSGLPDEVRTRLQAAGTYHVIAISGGNIAILTALLLTTFVPIGL